MDAAINVYGLGYIGLPTAATFANVGYQVLGVDICPEVVHKINTGEVHIQEPGLHLLVHSALQRGAFSAALKPAPADTHIIAVPTPVHHENGSRKSPDLSYVEAATRSIASVLKMGDLVVLESTVPPNTCLHVIAPLLYRLTGLRHGKDYDLSHCPERVLPGLILHEIIANDRIIGGTTADSTRRTVRLYASFAKGKLLATDATTAEMCKLMENTFRDVNIALANEFAAISKRIGIDVETAIRMANHHPRVNIHQPGIGVGGHCIPVDPWFIVHAAPDCTSLMQTARAINDARPMQIVEEVLQTLAHSQCESVSLLGLSYKPDIDDLRESPAVEIAKQVATQSHVPIYVVEPHCDCLPQELRVFPHVHFVTLEQALALGDLVVGLVGHTVFRQISDAQLRDKALLDPLCLWHASSTLLHTTAVCRSLHEETRTAGEAIPMAA